MFNLLKYAFITILFTQCICAVNAETLLQDDFTVEGVSSQWEIIESDAYVANISQLGDGFLHIEALGGNGYLQTGIEHSLNFPPPDFKVLVKVQADFGDLVGNKRGMVTLIDDNDNFYVMMIGRDFTTTWKGQVCIFRTSGVNDGCLNTEERVYTTNELVDFVFIKYESNIMFYMNGGLLFSEMTDFSDLNKVRLSVSTNTEPGFFSVLFDNIEIMSIIDASCPSSENDNVDAVITDHIFVSGDNGFAENSCLASNAITVGGTPSKRVIIQDGAEVNFVAPSGISFRPGVLIEQGSTFRALSAPIQATDG